MKVFIPTTSEQKLFPLSFYLKDSECQTLGIDTDNLGFVWDNPEEKTKKTYYTNVETISEQHHYAGKKLDFLVKNGVELTNSLGYIIPRRKKKEFLYLCD